MKFLLNISIIFICYAGFSQNPSYFTIGDNELQNAHIYSIIETKKGIVYVATNQGVYFYHNGRMKPLLNAQNQLSISLFNLIENSNGEVFCFNLNGQIFKIVNHKLQLYFSIPKPYLGPTISMVFDEKDNLIVASKYCLIVDNTQKFKVIYGSKKFNETKLNKLPNGKIVLVTRLVDTLCTIENQKLVLTRLPKRNMEFKHFFLLQNEIFGLSPKGELINIEKANTKSFYLQNEYNYEFVQFSDNEIWLRSEKGKVFELKLSNSEFKIQSVFDETYISKIFLNQDKTLYLGTFEKGVYVVPNRNIETYPINNVGNIVSYLAVSNDDQVYLSDLSKGIIKFSQTPEIIYNDPFATNSKLFTTSLFEANLVDDNPKILFDKRLAVGSLKDIYEIDTSTILLATSSGLAKEVKTKYLDSFKWNTIGKSASSQNSMDISERTQSVVFDKNSNSIYIATQNNLVKLGKFGKKTNITYNKKPIVAQDLLIDNGTIICGTKKSGVLFIKNDTVFDVLDISDKLKSNLINKMYLQNNLLFIWHNSGFQVFDGSKNLIGNIGMSDGLLKNSIRDFSLSKNNIWFLTSDKLISYPIKNVSNRTPNIQFSIDSISTSNNNFVDKTKFKPNENNLKFFYTFKGIPFVYDTEILYKIDKFDKDWTSINASTDFIEYKYLPSGNYNLQVKLKYENYETLITSYKFTIRKAFWNTWWFRFMTLIIILGLSFYFISRRIKYLKKRNARAIEEEKLKTDLFETQLKALRSQMNPHFIFNSLNSIQDLILEKKTEDSYDYIVLFSDLVRDILNYSNENYITLENEIDFLKRYLKLEKLRFGSHFSYKFNNHISNNKNIKIPPLLIQPFVENSIIHGLFHKQGEKNLNITFALDKELLLCIVEDNGIGRNASREIKKRQGKHHKSFALQSTKKRFDLLKKKNTDVYGFTFYDLSSTSEKSIGTKVVIKLPYW